MKAALYKKYGPPEVLKIEDIEKPKIKTKEILVRNFASSVTSGDFRMRGMNVPKGFKTIMRLVIGFTGPRNPIAGSAFAGEIVEVGANVMEFKVGDKVFGSTGMKMKGNAEFICIEEKDCVTHLPNNMTYEEAAGVSFGVMTALCYLRDKVKLIAGQNILINGASGAVGTASVQIAKYYGAEVTAVCSSKNHEMVRSIGADHVIDYHHTDFTTQDKKYDYVLETVGKVTTKDCKKVIKPGGAVLRVVGTFYEMVFSSLINIFSHVQIKIGVAEDRKEDLVFLKKLIESGKFKTIIDEHYFTLDQIAEAHRYAENGHKVGNLIIRIP